MKRTKYLWLLSIGLTISPSFTSYASSRNQIDYTQISGINHGAVPVRGIIYPENEGGTASVPSDWIHVTLPLSAYFWSDELGALDSSEFNVLNHSPEAVHVHVGEVSHANGNIQWIESLSKNHVPLLIAGETTDTGNRYLATLTGSEGENPSVSFQLTGELAAFPSEEERVQLVAPLTFSMVRTESDEPATGLSLPVSEVDLSITGTLFPQGAVLREIPSGQLPATGAQVTLNWMLGSLLILLALGLQIAKKAHSQKKN